MAKKNNIRQYLVIRKRSSVGCEEDAKIVGCEDSVGIGVRTK